MFSYFNQSASVVVWRRYSKFLLIVLIRARIKDEHLWIVTAGLHFNCKRPTASPTNIDGAAINKISKTLFMWMKTAVFIFLFKSTLPRFNMCRLTLKWKHMTLFNTFKSISIVRSLLPTDKALWLAKWENIPHYVSKQKANTLIR